MKSSIIALGALSVLAAAQPSGHRRHEHLHKRQDVYVTETEYFTATAPDVYIYVDQNGNTISSSVNGKQAAATNAPDAVTKTYQAQAQPTDSGLGQTFAIPAYSSVAPVAASSSAAASSSSASSPKSSSSPSSGSSSGINGISYSPYAGDYSQNNVRCKTADEVSADFEKIPDSYNLVRIYGTDCNQVENVIAAASNKNMKVFAGVFNIDACESELQTIIDAAQDNWDIIHTIAIGNELVNNGKKSASDVVSAVKSARSILSAANYPGKVVAVDTFVAIRNNPSLCEASDYAAANAHPYFDGTIAADGSGSWLSDTKEELATICGKNVMITETGWPWGGETNGVAVPSVQNQKDAISAIKKSVTENVIMFTAFNDMWKAAGYKSVEQSFGVYGSSASS